jgi:uncharacterized protein
MQQQIIYPTSLQRMTAAEIEEKISSEPDEAARWLYAAAQGGSARAQVVWGQILLDGRGVARDPEGAVRWFRIAALSGDPDGINMVGRCYENGWGVGVDPAEAARWFRRAADKGHDWAQFNLAALMLGGGGAQQDVRGALSLLVRSARRGNPKAMNMIGRGRELGWAGAVKLASAVRWYRWAADRGCFRGSYHLARFLATEGRIAEAASRFRESVERSPADFCRDAAAALLAAPEPEFQSIGRAALARAAESDEAADLFAYGKALASGQGGPADPAAARLLIARAHAKNFPGAGGALQEVSKQDGSLTWLAFR